MIRRFLSLAIPCILALVWSGCEPGPLDPADFDNSITVSSTVTPSNGQLTISKIQIRENGWLVVYADNGSNAPLMTSIIGKTPVVLGTTGNLQVVIDKDVANGQKLWATLHADDGETGVYEFTGLGSADQPIVDSTGVEVKRSFTISQATPAISTNDQVLTNGGVTLNLTAAEDGWIAVYTSNGGAPGTLLGMTHVNSGNNNGVTIRLDTASANAVDDGTQLWAVLHVDRGSENAFEFPGADFQVEIGGQTVRKSFTVSGATPNVLMTPQKIVNHRVVVDRVEARNRGWIVIHETDQNGDPITAQAIGRSRIPIGVSSSISITLDKDPAPGTLLVAMLHLDGSPVGAYQYTGPGTPDAPVLDGSSFFVMSSFKVLQ